MVVFEKVSVFAFRSLTQPCTVLGWGSNLPLLLALSATLAAQLAAVYWAPMQVLLRTEALALEHWALIGAFAAPLIVVPEVFKAVRSRAQRAK